MTVNTLSAQPSFDATSAAWLYHGIRNIKPIYQKDGKLWYSFIDKKEDGSRTIKKQYALRICKDSCHDALASEVSGNKDFIDFSALPTVRLDSIKNYLQGKEFVLKKDSAWLVTLTMIKPFYFITRFYNYRYNSYFGSEIVKTKQWMLQATNDLSLIPFHLPGNKWMLSDAGGRYYILPTAKAWLTNIADLKEDTYLSETIEPKDLFRYPATNPIDYKEFQLAQINGLSGMYESKKVDDGYQLQSSHGDILLAAVFDTIQVEQYYIATKKNGLYELYNAYLELLQNDIRDIEFGSYYAYTIVGNQLKTFTLTGAPTRQILETSLGLCGTVPHFHEKIKKEGGKFYFGTYINGPGAYMQQDDYTYQLIPGSYDTVSFLNQTDESYYTSNTSYGDDFNYRGIKLFIGERNGKKGIIDIDGKVVANIDYDSIVGNPQMTEPIRLFKKNSVQFLLFNDVDKTRQAYLSDAFLKADARIIYYVRVEMPNSKKAWLNLNTGKLLKDE